MFRTICRHAAALLFTVVSFAALADAREIEWNDLMPEEDSQAWIENQTRVDHSGTGPSEVFQSSRTIDELDGQELRIAGFVVPVETTAEGQLKEFFLVPYFGACIHLPPPPANQIIYGRLENPIDMINIWDAFYMEGTLNVEDISNDTADAAYTMNVDSLVVY